MLFPAINRSKIKIKGIEKQDHKNKFLWFCLRML